MRVLITALLLQHAVATYKPPYNFRGCFIGKKETDVDEAMVKVEVAGIDKFDIVSCSQVCWLRSPMPGTDRPVQFALQGEGECFCGYVPDVDIYEKHDLCDCSYGATVGNLSPEENDQPLRCMWDIPIEYEYHGCYQERKTLRAMKFLYDTWSYQPEHRDIARRRCASGCFACQRDDMCFDETNRDQHHTDRGDTHFSHFALQKGPGEHEVECWCGYDEPKGFRVYDELLECTCDDAPYPIDTTTNDHYPTDTEDEQFNHTATCVYSVPNMDLWEVPQFHNYEYSRSTTTTYLLSWELGHHRLGNTMRYEVQYRRLCLPIRPKGDPNYPGDASPTDYERLYNAAFGYLQSLKYKNSPSLHWYDDLNENKFDLVWTESRYMGEEPPKKYEIGIVWCKYTGDEDRGDAWYSIYNGTARFIRVGEPDLREMILAPGNGYEFRVRSCDDRHHGVGCSPWSVPLLTHTIFPGTAERIPFWIKGTGRNNHDYSIIEINNRVVYHRRKDMGLVLMVFSRLDMKLLVYEVFNTMHSREASEDMAKKLRAQDHSALIVVVSADAWEMRATKVLVDAMEYCGAYHFGQWTYVFAEEEHFRSINSDLDQTASQEQFGHPYAFVGIPGIGTGNGWESLALNTGHYRTYGKAAHAHIRGVLYYDYLTRHYHVTEVESNTNKYFLKGEPPVHNVDDPIPKEKKRIDPHCSKKHLTDWIQKCAPYRPYVTTIQSVIDLLIERNETVPRNYGFYIVTDAGITRKDQRPDFARMTELEIVLGGASARFFLGSSHRPGAEGLTYQHGDQVFEGMPFVDRPCIDYIYELRFSATYDSCGTDLSVCCDIIDNVNISDAFRCMKGVSPTLCSHMEDNYVYRLDNITQFRTINLNVPSHEEVLLLMTSFSDEGTSIVGETPGAAERRLQQFKDREYLYDANEYTWARESDRLQLQHIEYYPFPPFKELPKDGITRILSEEEEGDEESVEPKTFGDVEVSKADIEREVDRQMPFTEEDDQPHLHMLANAEAEEIPEIRKKFVDDLAKKSEDQHLTDGEKIAKIASQYQEVSFTELTDKELRKINVDARAAALFQLREEQQAARASNTRDDNDPFWKEREFEILAEKQFKLKEVERKKKQDRTSSSKRWQEILNRNQKDHERQQEQEMYAHEKQLQLRGKLTEADIKRYYNMLLVLEETHTAGRRQHYKSVRARLFADPVTKFWPSHFDKSVKILEAWRTGEKYPKPLNGEDAEKITHQVVDDMLSWMKASVLSQSIVDQHYKVTYEKLLKEVNEEIEESI